MASIIFKREGRCLQNEDFVFLMVVNYFCCAITSERNSTWKRKYSLFESAIIDRLIQKMIIPSRPESSRRSLSTLRLSIIYNSLAVVEETTTTTAVVAVAARSSLQEPHTTRCATYKEHRKIQNGFRTL